VLDSFKQLGRVVTLDLPGHAPARVPENFNHLDMDDLIDIEAEAVRHIAQGKKVHLVGHSAGGFVVIGLASKYPELVESIVSICPAVHGPVKGFLYPVKLGYEMLQSSFMSIIQKAVMTPFFSMELFFSFAVKDKNEFFERPEIQYFLKKYHQYFQLLDPRIMGLYLLMFDKCDLRPLAKTVDIPTLILVGKEDRVVPAEQGIELAGLMPQADLVLLENSGHVPTLEEREEALGSILDWLRSKVVQTESEFVGI
jgi:pimeloyl-ACP methyl ester carboxylesterase